MLVMSNNKTGYSKVCRASTESMCIYLTGGGNTTKQTLAAMCLLAALQRDGTVKLNKPPVTLTLKD